MSEYTGVPEGVLKLIQRYEAFRQIYIKSDDNETQLRREFVDPLFRALGWDVDNNQGFSGAYKDVVHEQTIKFRGHDTNTKFIDYSFHLGGVMKFIVETKKPSSKIADDARSALEIRRYAWNAKLSLNILTNFEEWSIYDCRIKPENSDPATKGRIKYFTYKDIAKEWDYLSSIFTRSAIQTGSFDAYAIETKGKKGTASVDDTFLAEIEEWRDRLAKNLALRNPPLTGDELNDAVQKTIDRIIFLRICEDRGIEKYETLKEVLEGPDTYQRLCALFLDADERYNSGLFHFREEKGNSEMPDGYTLTLAIDDKVIKDLVKRLYYPECQFEFSVMPTAILGQVYEQFLGKVIRLTEGHQAKVEYKPEVKKAGGVFYTPEYIVDYIVEHTVGELIKGKTPKEVSKIRVLDPACGSGSFLLGAYDKLLDWHRDWYIEHLVPVLNEKGETSPEVKALIPPDARGAENLPVYKASNGTDSRVRSDWNLTTAERKRILLNNIYGVDIDRQAVEVTKLSLLLKVLEEENEETVSKQLKLLKERALPSLHENIKCGNSLIGSDIYQDVRVTPDDPAVAKRINAFDWDVEFAEIMKGGGFDAVIGNPPYGAFYAELEYEYFSNKYRVFRGVKDVYALFIEKSLQIINRKGKFSFIVPSAWLGGPDYLKLRELILSQCINKIVLLPFDVFKDAYIDTLVFIVSKQPLYENSFTDTYVYEKRYKIVNISLASEDYQRIKQDKWNNSADKKIILNFDTIHLIEKIQFKNQLSLNNFVSVKRGVLFDKKILTNDQKNSNSHKYFEGDVYRYQINFIAKQWVEFGNTMKECPKDFFWFEKPRILLRRLVNRQQRLMATYVDAVFITNKNLYSVISNVENIDIKFILGLIDSKLISYLYVNQVTQATKDDFPQVTMKDLLALPFPNMQNNTTRHDKIIVLVERMLDLNTRLPEARTDQEQTIVKRQIAAADKEIDELVYELYGLTEEERRIVEGTI